MGTDLYAYAERKKANIWERIPGTFFDWRAYSLYAFLAGVRNYSGITPIAAARDLPADVSSELQKKCWDDTHNRSWLSIAELEAFDYEQVIEDRRCSGQIAPGFWSGAMTAPKGEGMKMTYREYLGEGFFEEVAKLKKMGAERIVFWFAS